ncbi:MAG: imidazole glycerol phosphate synthase subunit HisH [Anaerolineae bacterium]|nr:imidazole glycerol phosphate synthase subunit HisH [Anaerolineae bacterium]
MIAVIDYGAGNLRNVCKALEFVGANITLTDDPATIERADKIVLPGVGAFADCADGLRKRGLFELMQRVGHSDKPFLGICVGMQLLFEVGEEMGAWPGLGLLKGHVVRFDFSQSASVETQRLKIPHIGWNRVHPMREHTLLKGVPADGYAYFVHSYHAAMTDPAHVLATTDYGYDFACVVGHANIMGIQFHPEKSQDVGLQMLKNFMEI